MNAEGKLASVSRDIRTGDYVISFAVHHLPTDLEELAGCDALDITAKRHREKRSLNANAYFHVLVTKIAGKTGESITERKNSLIAEYGQIDRDLGTVILLDSIEWRKIDSLHLRPTSAVRVLDNGRLYRVFYVMRGSHTYDTAEMSRLIDAAVEQAKELGIETLPPNELERMKKAWK